ncbi:MFS transporter [Peterkaempfera sp. SMS 1(5)a]|uniref:MFS transporter n=1 Tax=Peterkaempfera podocarpi TaxID=3232308 RepID=UPI00367246E4
MSTDPRGGLLRRHRDFRLLWCGETTGKFGGAVTGVAMPLVAVSTLHAGTLEVSLLSAAAWLPWLLIGLPVGAWVDRMRRRPIMLIADAVSLLVFAAVPVAAWCGALSITGLIGASLLAGTAAVFFQTAYSAYLPGLLAPQDRPEGNAKLHGSASAAQIAGLGAGGLLAQAAGAVNAMYGNAATFLVSVLCLLGIRHREPRVPAAERPRKALVQEVGAGLRLVAGDPWIRTMTLFGAVSNLWLTGYQSIQVVFLVREVGLASGAVGGLIAATSVGGVVGALVARRVAARAGTARALLAFELGVPVLALLIPLTTGGAGLVCYVVGGLSVSGGVVAGNVIKSSFQQSYCPPALLGRVAASSAFLNYGTIPLGAVLAGVLGTTLGIRPAMWITTAGVPLAALILYFSPIRRCRDLPSSPPEKARTTEPQPTAGASA